MSVARDLPPLEVLAPSGTRAWLVGGAVRERVLGRSADDFDVVVEGDTRAAARRLAEASAGHRFELSGAFEAWRVISRERSWQVDLLPLAGDTIEADLAQRDLTVNAIAQALPDGSLVDPFGGVADVQAARLRAVAPDAFLRDPLRVLRLARFTSELGFDADPGTIALGRNAAPGLRRVAAERVFEELKRIMISMLPLRGLALMEALGATEVVLPELRALQGVQQSRFHHLDVLDHTLAVVGEVAALERDPTILGSSAAAVDELLSQPLANGVTRWQALRFGALLHDIAKPQTRRETQEGRVTFMCHDRQGAHVARGVLSRLRTAERLREHVTLLVAHHLRLGFMVQEMPLARERIYDYLNCCEPVGVDVTVLSVADRLATRGERAEEAIAKHLRLARQMLGEAVEWEVGPPACPVRGDELARALELTPGPELGRLLAELRRAKFAGWISDREQAIEHARSLLGSDR